jgi:hypothetical protein
VHAGSLCGVLRWDFLQNRIQVLALQARIEDGIFHDGILGAGIVAGVAALLFGGAVMAFAKKK